MSILGHKVIVFSDADFSVALTRANDLLDRGYELDVYPPERDGLDNYGFTARADAR
jgi:hypothetical protein